MYSKLGRYARFARWLVVPGGLALGMLVAALALGVFRTPGPVIAAASTYTVSPNTGGDIAENVFTFTLGSTANMPANIGVIKITFDKDTTQGDFKPISSISRANVLVSATILSDLGTGAATGTTGANQAVTLAFDPVIENSTEPERIVVTIKVPDMNPSTTSGGAGEGAQGIAAGADVTVTFTPAAGLRNDTERGKLKANISALASSASTAELIAGASSNTTNIEATVKSQILLDGDDAARGDKLNVRGKGFKDGRTVTLWLDTNDNNTRDSTEIDLGSGIVAKDGTFSIDITVNNPPFNPGFGLEVTAVTGTCASGKSLGAGTCKTNRVAAIDGSKDANTADIKAQLLELKPTVTANPKTGNPGDTITVQIKDFPANREVPGTQGSITVGGVAVTTVNGAAISTSTPKTGADGELTFTIRIPNGVPAGKQDLLVKGKGSGYSADEDTKLTIGGATVILTPTSAVPNQTISLIGTGFTTSDIATGVTVSTITIGGTTIGTTKISEGKSVTVDAGGNWSASVVLPINSTTTTGGTHELKVKDSAGRDGVVNLVIPSRTIVISPTQGRVGSVVTVTGAGYPGNNTKTGAVSKSVEIKYDAGTGLGSTTISVTPDSSGNIRGEVVVPQNSNIPSTNTVTTKYTDESSADVITSTTHSVPRATLTLSPTTGVPGSVATVQGTGFKRFVSVETLKMGTIDVTPSPKPNTGDNGDFTASILIPSADIGVQTVEATVGGVVASTGFTIGVAPAAPPPPTTVAPATGLAPLGANLERVWNFNNQSKSWSFYDPRPDFAAISTVSQLVVDQVYWVKVSSNQTVTLGGKSRALYAGWNLIPW